MLEDRTSYNFDVTKQHGNVDGEDDQSEKEKQEMMMMMMMTRGRDPLVLKELEDQGERRILLAISALSNEVVGGQALNRLQ